LGANKEQLFVYEATADLSHTRIINERRTFIDFYQVISKQFCLGISALCIKSILMEGMHEVEINKLPERRKKESWNRIRKIIFN
jgi:hypothetical protein